jgi:hypothetical protein
LKVKKYYFPVFAAMLAASTAHAATFDMLPGSKTTNDSILVSGTLEAGDGDAFKAIAETIAPSWGMVFFSSPGGSLRAGLSIGDTIRERKFATGILSGNECSSACAYAWLAGSPRTASSGSYIGFHAVSAGGEISSSGNAILGAYLGGLGFDRATIRYMTTPGPQSIQWLNAEDAKKYGIKVHVTDEDKKS